MNLKVSASGRYLVDQNDKPFFYLADTAWEMLHRLSLDETKYYLEDRAAKGFTVIQTVILAELDGLRVPNANGDIPLQDLDPTRPVEGYFAYIDMVLALAQDLGLVLALLPTWGDKWSSTHGVGPVVFTPENARVYGEYLGRRYAETPNIIWVLGGDRVVENETHRAITEAMAEGLDAGGSKHLKTWHPRGYEMSSQYFHESPWLDFNMMQTGHSRNSPNFEKIAADYARTPIKPTLDGEPGYDDHKNGGLENGYLDDYDSRKALYWALFSGACGHTHGCHPIWQFWQKGRKAVNHPRREWKEAMALPASTQMGFARKLHDKYLFVTGEPAPEIIVQQPQNKEGQENKPLHVAAVRGQDGEVALLYFPSNLPVELQLDSLRGNTFKASWFDPRAGVVDVTEQLEKGATNVVTPPDWGPDWVLILEAI